MRFRIETRTVCPDLGVERPAGGVAEIRPLAQVARVVSVVVCCCPWVGVDGSEVEHIGRLERPDDGHFGHKVESLSRWRLTWCVCVVGLVVVCVCHRIRCLPLSREHLHLLAFPLELVSSLSIPANPTGLLNCLSITSGSVHTAGRFPSSQLSLLDTPHAAPTSAAPTRCSSRAPRPTPRPRLLLRRQMHARKILLSI